MSIMCRESEIPECIAAIVVHQQFEGLKSTIDRVKELEINYTTPMVDLLKKFKTEVIDIIINSKWGEDNEYWAQHVTPWIKRRSIVIINCLTKN